VVRFRSVARHACALALAAFVTGAQGATEAELKASVAAKEAAHGPDHAEVAQALSDLADFYQPQARLADMQPLLERALAIRQKADGAEHPDVLTLQNNLAWVLQERGRLAEAEAMFLRTLAAREKVLGPAHADVAVTLNNLAVLYDRQGRYAESEAAYLRSLAVMEQALGPDHPDFAIAVANLATMYVKRARYADAQPLLERSLAIMEKVKGPDHAYVASVLELMGWLDEARGRFPEAEVAYQRALAIRERTLRPDHPAIAKNLNSLAQIRVNSGRYDDAERLLRRTLEIHEAALGPEHPEVGTILANLGFIYRAQGRHADAEPLYLRALAIEERALGPDHVGIAATLNNLAEVYRMQRRYTEAEPLYKRSIAIREKALGPNHPSLARSLHHLAELYQDLRAFAEAEALYRRSIEIMEATLGPGHPEVASVLNNLGALYWAQGRHADARAALERGLAIYEKSVGDDHLWVVTSLRNLAQLELAQRSIPEALALARRASALLRARFTLADEQSAGQLSEQRVMRPIFVSHVELLDLSAPSGGERDAAAAEAFEVAQLATATNVGHSLAQMAARFSRSEGDLATSIRTRQDTSQRLARAEKSLVDSAGRPAAERDAAAEASLRAAIARLQSELTRQTQDLTVRFPEYQSMVSPAPVPLREAMSLLRADEALVVYLIDGASAYAWVVRPRRAEFVRLPVRKKELDAEVARLRARLDPLANPQVVPLDYAAAHGLYERVFAPFEGVLAGARHVIVVADGALQSLPLAVLVDRPPSTGGANPAKVSWLADRFAFSVQPSVGALRALRTFARKAKASQPLVGFGDPVLSGKAGEQRVAARAIFQAPAGGGKDGARASPLAALLGIADVEALRRAPALPETAAELRAYARALGARPDELFLGSRATETEVKRRDLSQARVLAFSTHGLMAGDLSGVAEPGLILTPPLAGTELDDGFLAASEVAQLKLNADWVLLSACNTAAPDGTPGAEGLSGLARAFFYAGARSLLVSNWAVASDATVALTTGMLKRYAADPKLGKAEALRRAMLEVKRDPKYGHPLYWAPFVVVGEGGR
jgi:CHAT domain-containing protein/tetratricopeptide (TPR) repeat protein